MREASASFDLSSLGAVYESEEFRVNSVRLAQFAAAIDDENPAHREGALASLVFVNVLPMEVMMKALRRVTGAFCVHGAHDFRYHRPIVPGMRLFSGATVHGIRQTSAGVQVIIRLETWDQRRAPVATQYFTGFAVGAALPHSAGEPAPDHRAPESVTAAEPFGTLNMPMRLDQTHRYADAARDYSDYTLDRQAARARGFQNVLVHGMLTMAFAARAVVKLACEGDSRRLKRLAGRFSGLLYLLPGQSVTTTLWRFGTRKFAFESRDASRAIVIKHGRAEVET